MKNIAESAPSLSSFLVYINSFLDIKFRRNLGIILISYVSKEILCIATELHQSLSHFEV